MKISEMIQKELINVNLKSNTSESALAEIVEHLFNKRKIKDKKQILNMLLKREKLGSTCIAEGLAIPHARISDLKEPLIFIGLSRRGINFVPSPMIPHS